jgi:hypothetical protein
VREIVSLPGGAEAGLIANTFVISIAYDDGSLASIVYAADGYVGTEKEQIEVLGRGHTVLISDFRILEVDGKKVTVEPGKGHVDGLRAFGAALASGGTLSSESSISSMRATLLAAGHS